MQPEPNYRACVDPGDITQLTDGKTVAVTEQNVGPWVKKEMVGWAKKRDPIMITLDLESDQAISGFGFHTAAGGGGVVWPAQIAVFTGVDGKEWHYEGDLRVMSASASSAPSDGGGFGGAVMHLFSTRDLKTHGRYVRFVIVGSTYVFSDEV